MRSRKQAGGKILMIKIEWRKKWELFKEYHANDEQVRVSMLSHDSFSDH